MPKVKRTITAVTGLVTALFATAVTASTLLIWPIHPVIESSESATALWVENRGDKPVLTQLRLFDWRQQGGDDQYFPQTDMVVSPPMVEIPAGERQLMRLIRQTPAPPGQERAWRLIIDEVPQAAGAGDEGSPSQTRAGINLQMRYSLPLFDYGEGLSASPDGSDVAASLSWQLVQDNGRHYLQISNAGKRHVRLTNVFFQQGSGRQVVSDGLLGYVLPGNFRRWPLERPVSAGSTLSATVNGTAVNLTSRGTLN